MLLLIISQSFEIFALFTVNKQDNGKFDHKSGDPTNSEALNPINWQVSRWTVF